jgi:hypothetical protein
VKRQLPQRTFFGKSGADRAVLPPDCHHSRLHERTINLILRHFFNLLPQSGCAGLRRDTAPINPAGDIN